MLARSLLELFMTAIRVYCNARVTVWEADAFGQRTDVKATLYESLTGDAELENPQELDSEGKFGQPVYFDTPVIATVDGLTVGTHQTGIIKPHVEAISAVPTGPAGGDLAGSYPDPTLAPLHAGGVYGSSTETVSIAIDTKGRVVAISSGPISFPPTAPSAPAGPAGGDLTGTYPNPTLADMPEATVKGRAVGSGAGHPINLTAAQLAAIVAAGGGGGGGGLEPGTIVDYAGAVLPPKYLWPNGQAVSRTTYAALYANLGTAHGAGDGSTTFNLPDVCGCVVVGRDNMGGPAKGRLTFAGSGIDGTVLGARGGSETCTLTLAQVPVHAHGVNDPTHAHSVYDPGHAHGVSDPSHYHPLADPGHAHGVNDPGHAHNIAMNTSGAFGAGGQLMGGPSLAGTNAGLTGISIAASGTNSYANYNYTGIAIVAAVSNTSIYGAATGITVQNAGSGAAHPNVQATIVLNKILYAGV